MAMKFEEFVAHLKGLAADVDFSDMRSVQLWAQILQAVNATDSAAAASLPPMPPAAPTVTDIDVNVAVDEPAAISEEPVAVDNDVAGLLAQLENVVNDAADTAIPDAVLPSSVTFAVSRTDGLPLNTALGIRVVEAFLPSLEDQSVTGVVLATPQVVNGQVLIVGHVHDMDSRNALVGFGIGTTAVEGAIPTPDAGIVSITMTVGQPEDRGLADAMGLVPHLAPREDGAHPLTGVLDSIEEHLGVRPSVPVLKIRFTRVDRSPMSDDNINFVLNHPITTGGLARFGQLVPASIDVGEGPHERIVTFVVGDAGEIDPALVADQLRVVAYSGTVDFGGDLGRVSANAQATIPE